MTPDEIAELFGRRTQAFARQDAVALAADFTEDGVLYSPTAGTIIGRRGIERVYRLWFKAFPDLKWEVNDLVIAGDRVATLNTITGTDLGGFLGLPPTGRFIRLSGAFVFTFRDALIVTERRVLDFGGVLLQLAGEVGPVTDSFRRYRETLARARLEQELLIAADIQRALLPRTQYRNARFEVAATSLPCRAIGGDFFDYSESSGGTLDCVLGDVAGKGPPAALLTAVLQGILTANADSGLTPAKTIGRVNTALLRRTIESRFATLWYAMLSCDGCLTSCNAGHIRHFFLDATGSGADWRRVVLSSALSSLRRSKKRRYSSIRVTHWWFSAMGFPKQ